jgi:hypothetical protein
MVAARWGHESVVKHLLSAGANPNHANKVLLSSCVKFLRLTCVTGRAKIRPCIQPAATVTAMWPRN